MHRIRRFAPQTACPLGMALEDPLIKRWQRRARSGGACYANEACIIKTPPRARTAGTAWPALTAERDATERFDTSVSTS